MDVFEHSGDLNEYLKEYKYGSNLTEKLDALDDKDLDLMSLYEIVLWKVNRYVEFNKEIIAKINELKNLKKGEHRKAEIILDELIKMDGIDLPMASTILRFRNPEVFPIIDKRAYRAIYNKKYPLYFTTPRAKKITTYFKYIDKLMEVCEMYKLDFKTIDRLLYQFDIENNGKL